MSALDSSGAEQPADHLGFYLVSDRRNEDVFVGHASRLLDSRRTEERAERAVRGGHCLERRAR
jgi:hypothetical protein